MTPTDLSLRPATSADVASMVEVRIAARAAAPMPDEPAARQELHDDLLVGLVEDHLWVAEGGVAGSASVGTETLGYVRFVTPDEERVGWLDDLYVVPPAQGRGVGSALLDLVQAHLPGGFGLWAFASNAPARAFYARRGARVVEEVPADESPTGHAELHLAL